VQVSADASASWSKYGNELALRRMEQAGAVITTVDYLGTGDRLDQPERPEAGGNLTQIFAHDTRCMTAARVILRSGGLAATRRDVRPREMLASYGARSGAAPKVRQSPSSTLITPQPCHHSTRFSTPPSPAELFLCDGQDG
jgi:hypothetical protein